MLFIPFTGVSTEESLVRSNPAMFITVMFGAGCWELVNPCCSLVTLTAHLRRRGQVPPDVTIALLAEDGHLVSLGEGLEEETSLTPFVGSLLLQERGTYVLVQVISKWGLRLPAVAMLECAAPTRYESMLENLDDWYPELAVPATRVQPDIMVWLVVKE
ncbi:uncharacterized protein Cadr_000028319 [Camelus dromedarius]|uniref:Uncharacterized protein n=1 Tax=Camelus dromedarius TaxID=9838 RepID=A0A5N4C8S5_CAMDR|nr:uncharacterized protein Cadr_000028319 [Camelus dromedarius]